MKREDIRKKIAGITEEQLEWLMEENGRDITREKTAAETIRSELDTANTTIQELQETAKKYEGVDVAGLQKQLGEAPPGGRAEGAGNTGGRLPRRDARQQRNTGPTEGWRRGERRQPLPFALAGR